MMSAFPTATFKCHNDTETYMHDVVSVALDVKVTLTPSFIFQ